MGSSVQETCRRIAQERQSISIEQLKSSFDQIVAQLTSDETLDDYCQIVETLKKLRLGTLIDASIISHPLFHELQQLFVKVFGNNDGSSTEFVAELIDLYSKLITYIKNTDQVLTSLPSFGEHFLHPLLFQRLSTLLIDLSDNAWQYEEFDGLMKNVNNFFRLIQWYQGDDDAIRNHPTILLLVDPMIRCLSSSSTLCEMIKKIPLESDEQSPLEEFFLQRCPCYTVWNRGEAQLRIIEGFCHSADILQVYAQIYELLLPTIDLWDHSLMQSIFYFTALLRYVALYSSTRQSFSNHPQLVQSVLILLNNNRLVENCLINTDYNAETNVIDSVLSLLFNLCEDSSFLSSLKENPLFSKGIFLRLKQSKVDRIRLNSFLILSKILNEKDIQQLDQVENLLTIFMTYLIKASQDSCHTFEDIPIEHLLISLKAFIQHDQIKEEIFKQNYFPFLIRCATQVDLHLGLVLQISLEIIWALIFHHKLRRLLLDNYEDFRIYLKEILINSNEQGVQAAAKGILWQLESHANITKTPEQLQSIETVPELKYDLMISYSHANKDLCYQIHKSLLKNNFRVWLDFDNMYGSTLQSMATAIESSEIVVICMSNPYKQSAYCRSEAEYAYTRQRKIIPLVMEKKYRPDGWLGFICASKLYVDFTKMDFDTALQKLLAQIQLHREEKPIAPSSATNIDRKSTPLTHDDECASTIELLPAPDKSALTKKQQIPSDQRSEGEQSFEHRYIKYWTHEDILSFLHHRHLDLLKPLFESEPHFNGQSLYELYKQCQTNSEGTYQLLNTEFVQLQSEHLPYLTYLHFVTELQKRCQTISLTPALRRLFCSIRKKTS